MPAQPERAPSADPGPPPQLFSNAYRSYVLGLLVVVYVFNFVDRQILYILLESIKQDLQVSDTALGFLSGTAFAVFYTFAGIPLARWADAGTRRNIIALAIFVWSGMTALTGLTRTFPQLLLARIGVGIGEAGCSPPAHSLISDYFPPERRATALSIYALGIPIGSAIGYLAGGWLDEWFDWRTAFLVVGLPGVALALVVRLTLREPPRGHADPDGTDVDSRQTTGEVLGFILSLRSFVHMSIGAALHSLYGYGAGAFIPAFLRRVHEIPSGEVGTWLFAVGLTTGVAGTFLGGYLSDWIGKRDPRWYVWVPALATVVYIPFAFLFYLWPDGRQAFAFFVPAALLGSMYLGPSFALAQGLVKPRMRALASAILLFILNLIGLGLGPQLVGFLSDLLAPRYGVDSVRYALLYVVVIGAAWSTLHYALAARTLREDLRAKDA